MSDARGSVVVGFIHTYSKSGGLDSYFSALVNAFVDKGVAFHLVLVNDLLEFGHLGGNKFRDGITDFVLIEWLSRVNPDLVLTSNHAGLTPGIIEALTCPIVTWMVDRVPFKHFDGSDEEIFSSKEIVITSSRNNVPQFQKIYPKLKGRVHFLPFATNATSYYKDKNYSPKHNISFVGTYFYRADEFQNILLEASKKDCDQYERLMNFLDDLSKNYNLDLGKTLDKYRLNDILTEYGYRPFELKSIAANMISLNSRIQSLEKVSDLGLSLYGTENWFGVGSFSVDLLRCFRPKEKILSRNTLLDQYGNSLISLNIPHHQAVGGLPYRVYDIMASPSLLITPNKVDSDLHYLFGNDIPVPTFSSPSELRDLAKYYLLNHEERQKIVSICNDRISKGCFTFEDRVEQIFDIAGVRLKKRCVGYLTRLNVEEIIDRKVNKKISVIKKKNERIVYLRMKFFMLLKKIPFLKTFYSMMKKKEFFNLVKKFRL